MDEQEQYEFQLLRTKYNNLSNRFDKSTAKVKELTDQVAHQKQAIDNMSAELGKFKRRQKRE